ncbi:MAG TPA: hydroxymethylbilane synthase [Anaerolineae bacterium]|nr:hydroxymethylbilane synthase [Anaerolineae bacterium]HIP69854.1 hydroxymethylbilane synthase [Anaerolineae bacterium]
MNHHTLIIGTRTSQLAMWQTDYITALLQAVWPELECRTESFVTKGDKTLNQPLPQIGGKGLFTWELENALRDGRIHLAVHSLKDLPVENAPGLTLGAIVGRADVRDVLIGLTLEDIPLDGVVGTSSLRRHAQLRRLRPDVAIRSIRGNVETRIRKVTEGQYDAAILAAAGVTRLGLEEHIAQYLPLAAMLPAPGQGALAVQCRADDAQTLELLAVIHNPNVATVVTAERAFLNGLGGGCATPVAAYAELANGELHLTGLVSALDGKRQIRVTGSGTDGRTLGLELAEEALVRGAREILRHV